MLDPNHNNVELSPCIVAKVRYALYILLGYQVARAPVNRKTCTQHYWNRVVEAFSYYRGGLSQEQKDDLNGCRQNYM
jgi:hypothetical protein